MKIELLFFDGCPNYQTALKYLQEVIREKRHDIPVKMLKIKSDNEAENHRFLGSPTIRINGQDVETGAEKADNFSMVCRLYLEDNKVNELPSKKMIRHAIKKAIQETST